MNSTYALFNGKANDGWYQFCCSVIENDTITLDVCTKKEYYKKYSIANESRIRHM